LIELPHLNAESCLLVMKLSFGNQQSSSFILLTQKHALSKMK